MFYLIPPGTKVDFVGKRHLWLGLSIVAIVASAFGFFTKGLNYGVDFTGGAEVQVRLSSEGWDTAKVRSIVEKGGFEDARIQQIKTEAGRPVEFNIRVQAEEAKLNQIGEQMRSAFSASLPEGPQGFELGKVDVVGPAAGGALREKGFLSMFYALIAILVYVAVRFDSRFAPGAVIALFHDTVLTIGVFVVLGTQFDLTILAALMILIGYSNNDTIIVYDRIREVIQLQPNLKIEEIVNRSLNETLGRTIVTSLATLITALALYLFGGEVIEGFALTFMIGIVIGTYSSIYVASSVLIWMTNYNLKRAGKARVSGMKSKLSEIKA
jgi:preprotein translocase subunit SecF